MERSRATPYARIYRTSIKNSSISSKLIQIKNCITNHDDVEHRGAIRETKKVLAHGMTDAARSTLLPQLGRQSHRTGK
jgi:hypothetical protein